MKHLGITLHQRIVALRWASFLIWIPAVLVFQLVIASWIHDRFQEQLHYVAEILFFGAVGPLLTLWFLALIGNWLDEGEQVEKKAQLIESRLASITNISADAILSLDAQGTIISWNPGAAELFGFLATKVQGEPFSELMGGGNAAEAEWSWIDEMVRRQGYLRGHETVCCDARGRAVHVELTATPLEDEQGLPSGTFLVLRDITQGKQREEEFRRLNESLNEQVANRTIELAEKIEALARANTDLQKLDQMRMEFVSLVSHQLRAPLTNMGGAVENIRAGCGIHTAACIRMLDILDQQIARLDRLVGGVLSTARIETGEMTFHPEPISISPLIRQVTDQFRVRQIGRTIHLADKPGLPMAFADRDRVAEVMANLLDNADKYSPAGNEIFVDLRADQTEVTVSVRDTGPGLLPEDIERVFEKFYRIDSSDAQTAYGYGLGLYVCRKLVEAQRGRIWAENHPAGGAVFAFSLPVWQEQA